MTQNTLYDALGQRQINTMYTQVNQCHVVLESEPDFHKDPNRLDRLYIQSNTSSGATGPRASASFASSGSSSAGSNALTSSALYTPSATRLSSIVNSPSAARAATSAATPSSTLSSSVP